MTDLEITFFSMEGFCEYFLICIGVGYWEPCKIFIHILHIYLPGILVKLICVYWTACFFGFGCLPSVYWPGFQSGAQSGAVIYEQRDRQALWPLVYSLCQQLFITTLWRPDYFLRWRVIFPFGLDRWLQLATLTQNNVIQTCGSERDEDPVVKKRFLQMLWGDWREHSNLGSSTVHYAGLKWWVWCCIMTRWKRGMILINFWVFMSVTVTVFVLLKFFCSINV